MESQQSGLEPLVFTPLFFEKIWGGRNLYRLFKKGPDSTEMLGESWEISDNNSGKTKVAKGKFAGQELGELLSKYPSEILGKKLAEQFGNKKAFPLLIKFIDATDDLSVQVHPGEGSDLGDAKTEAWYVVDAPAEAQIIVGLDSELSKEKVLEALKSSKARDVLRRIPVKAGDVLVIPAGTVHAITKGLVIYEVQQNSDTTFRIYDWDRLDASGKSRELHVDKAAQTINFTNENPYKSKPLSLKEEGFEREFLGATPFFLICRLKNFNGDARLDNKDKFQVLTVLEGHFEVKHGESKVSLNPGDSCLLPAVCQNTFLKNVQGKGELLSSTVPDLAEDVWEPLSNAGFAEDEITRIGGGTLVPPAHL